MGLYSKPGWARGAGPFSRKRLGLSRATTNCMLGPCSCLSGRRLRRLRVRSSTALARSFVDFGYALPKVACDPSLRGPWVTKFYIVWVPLEDSGRHPLWAICGACALWSSLRCGPRFAVVLASLRTTLVLGKKPTIGGAAKQHHKNTNVEVWAACSGTHNW